MSSITVKQSKCKIHIFDHCDLKMHRLTSKLIGFIYDLYPTMALNNQKAISSEAKLPLALLSLSCSFLLLVTFDLKQHRLTSNLLSSCNHKYTENTNYSNRVDYSTQNDDVLSEYVYGNKVLRHYSGEYFEGTKHLV